VCFPFLPLQFIVDLGVTDSSWTFTDVYGLDSEMLEMVPRPVVAVLLLYPITEKNEAARIEEDKVLEEGGPQTVSPRVFFVKQTIGNACGTMGLIHAVCNNRDRITQEGFFREFFESSGDLTPDTRASKLEESEALSTVHNDLALEGQSAVCPLIHCFSFSLSISLPSLPSLWICLWLGS